MKTIRKVSKVLFIILIAISILSCGTAKRLTKSQKVVVSSVPVAVGVSQTQDFSGTYNWVVPGTPNGDQTGSMSLKKTETGYLGQMDAMGMSVPIDKIQVKGNTMTGLIAIQDLELDFSIVFESGGFKGSIYTADDGFPFNGKKMK